MTPASEVELAEHSELVISPSSPKTNLTNLLDGDELNKQVADHKRLLEKLAAGRDDPPWATPGGSGRARAMPYGSKAE